MENIVQILLLKSVYKFTTKKQVAEARIKQAVDEIVSGNIDACLGSNIYKQRVASHEKASLVVIGLL